MKDEQSSDKSLPDQIIEKALESMRQRSEFNQTILDGLSQLYNEQKLNNYELVIGVIKPRQEEI